MKPQSRVIVDVVGRVGQMLPTQIDERSVNVHPIDGRHGIDRPLEHFSGRRPLAAADDEDVFARFVGRRIEGGVDEMLVVNRLVAAGTLDFVVEKQAHAVLGVRCDDHLGTGRRRARKEDIPDAVDGLRIGRARRFRVSSSVEPKGEVVIGDSMGCRLFFCGGGHLQTVLWRKGLQLLD